MATNHDSGELNHYSELDTNTDLSDVDYSDVEIEHVLRDTERFKEELERVGARKFARALIQAAEWTEETFDGDELPKWVVGESADE